VRSHRHRSTVVVVEPALWAEIMRLLEVFRVVVDAVDSCSDERATGHKVAVYRRAAGLRPAEETC
jgi:hypothetical protein